MKKYFAIILVFLLHLNLISLAAEIPKGTKVKLKATEIVTSKDPIAAGDEYYFEITQDVKVKGNTVIKNGEQVVVLIDHYTKRENMGVPAEIEISTFKTKTTSGKTILLPFKIDKIGSNRGKVTVPVGYYGGMFLLVPYLLFLIKGGHCSIKRGQEFELETKESVAF